MAQPSWNRVCFIEDLCSDACSEHASKPRSPIGLTTPLCVLRAGAGGEFSLTESRRDLLLVEEALNEAAYDDRHRELVLLAPRL